MKYIPGETAFAKLRASAEDAAIVSRELHGSQRCREGTDASQAKAK
jgi:hypothetical protein